MRSMPTYIIDPILARDVYFAYEITGLWVE